MIGVAACVPFGSCDCACAACSDRGGGQVCGNRQRHWQDHEGCVPDAVCRLTSTLLRCNPAAVQVPDPRAVGGTAYNELACLHSERQRKVRQS